MKKKYDHYYWMLDQRFDFLIPWFQEYFGIDERKQITFIGSFHGPSRTGEEWDGVTKELVRKNERGKLIYAGPENKENSAGGNAVWLEPEDVNLAYRDQINTDGDTLVVSFSGANLPEEVDSFIATGEVASKLNSKWEQFLLLTDREEIKLEANKADDRRKELNEYLNKEGSDIVIRKAGTFGSNHIAVIRNRDDAKWYCNSLEEPDLENRFFKSPYTPLNSKNKRERVDLDGADDWKTELKNEIDSFFKSSKNDQVLIEDNEGAHIVIISNDKADIDWYCGLLEKESLPRSIYISRYSLPGILTPETIELRLHEELPDIRRKKLTNSVQELIKGSKSEKVVIKKPDLSGGYRMCIAANTDEVEKYCGLLNEKELDGKFLVSEYIPHKQSFAGIGIVSKEEKRNGKAKVTYCGLTEQVLYHELAYEGLIWPAFWDSDSKRSVKARKDDIKKITKVIGEKLANLGYFGFYNVDFIEEEKTGRMYVAEINARFGFGTILYALKCGEDVNKDAFFDAIQGKNPPKLNDEASGNNRILLGKIKGITGKQYKSLFNMSDIESWYNKDGERFRTYYLQDETFEYGSFAGLFGEKIPETLDRNTALVKFMDICLLRGKRLVSMYVDNYCGLEKVFFNFDLLKQYRRSDSKDNRNGDNEISCIKNSSNKYEGFWSIEKCLPEDKNVMSLTLMIGKNGSGKTTLMRLAVKWISQLAIGCFPSEKGAIIVDTGDGQDAIIAFSNTEDNSEDYYFYGGNAQKNSGVHVVSDKSKIIELLKNVGILYYTETMTDLGLDTLLPIDQRKQILESVLTDASEMNEQVEIFSNLQNGMNPINAMRNKELRHMLRVWGVFGIKELRSKYVRISIKGINMVSAQDPVDWNRELQRYGLNTDSIVRDLEETLKDITGILENKIQQWGLLWLLFGVLELGLKNAKASSDKLFSEKCNNAVSTLSVFLRGVEFDNHFWEGMFKDIYGLFPEENECPKIDYKSIIYYLMSPDLNDEDLQNNGWVLELNTSGTKIDYWYQLLNQLSTETINNLLYDRFTFDLSFQSSGERNWSGLLASLAECLEKRKEYIFCFLDEPDNSFHPAWKRTLVNDLIEKYKELPQKVQLFVSSHSPIILSDAPRDAAILFDLEDKNKNAKRNKKEIKSPDYNPFGQQIYTLYYDSFFMKEGVVGKFASKKIKTIDKALENIKKRLNMAIDANTVSTIENELEACKRIIELVDEPLVGGTLRLKYNWCRKELAAKKNLEK